MSRYSAQGPSPPAFRPVNSLLGARPTIGPIPADLFIPFGAISLVMALLSSQFLGLGIEWTLALIIWGCTTWWILTGSRPYRFLSKFTPVPQRWSRAHVRYSSLQAVRAGLGKQVPSQRARGSGRRSTQRSMLAQLLRFGR